MDKDKYYIPKNLVDRFEDGTVYFRLTAAEQQAKQYKEYETNLI